MFNRRAASGKALVANGPIVTLLGEGTRWEGEIHAGSEGLRIEGHVEGTVLSEGHVVVGPTGVMKGTIHAKCLTVMGRVEGIFRVEECLEILETGSVDGEVELGTMVVDEGGTFTGTCLRRTLAKEVVPLIQRKEASFPESQPQVYPANRTQGAFPDGLRPFRGVERKRY